MNNTWRAMTLATAAATGALACGDSTSGPAWSGTAASVSLEWTINGTAASTSTCRAVGGDFVALWVAPADPGCSPGAESCGEALESWLWDCSAGTAQTGLDFRAGSVWLAWTLVSTDGAVREATRWQEAALTSGNRGFRFDFTPTPVGSPNAAIVSTWTLAGAAADAASCTAAGAETVRLVTRITGATVETPVDFPCQDGSASTGNNYRATQRYDLRWELRDASGTTLAPYPATGWQTAQMVEGDNPFTPDFPAAPPP
ncbi:MAG: hypothetical protein HY825_16165 [Acidobacteria bacterium]|nr:hypothetical protein [Acidobacteriota bacterium]